MYFDFLIDKGNKEPDSNTEYVYNFNMRWEKGSYESIPTEKGIIVNNVKREKCGRFTFTIKGETRIYTCNYGWAFIKNTKSNLIKLKEYEDIQREIERLENLRTKWKR